MERRGKKFPKLFGFKKFWPFFLPTSVSFLEHEYAFLRKEFPP